jgi:GNAT superfamily N-acetyltransferase
MIEYRIGKSELKLDDIIEVYRDSTIRRPIDDRACMEGMFEHANLVVSAWDGELLVGISRSLSDFCFCTYLADLAVRLAYQKRGIGRELIKQTRRHGKTASIFLFAAPSAVDYYPHVGFEAGSGWILKPRGPV